MERFKAAKCPIHGADRHKGKGCEVFNERKRGIDLKKRHHKRSRQAGKNQSKEF